MSARRLFAQAALVTALVVALFAPAAAFGAAAPQANGNLDLQTWLENGNVIIVTALTVPDSVKLPTVVRIPVPEGATVQWAGEVLGGDLSADPSREYKLVKSPAGGQYAEFTIEETRSAQVDSSMASATVEGATTSASFTWVQSVDSPLTSFAVRVPANVSNVKITPTPSGVPDKNASGESLYSTDPAPLKPGSTTPVSFTYTTGAAPATTTSSSGMTALIVVLVVALAVALGALFYLLSRQNKPGQPPARKAAERPSAAAAASGKQEPQTPQKSEDDWGFSDDE